MYLLKKFPLHMVISLENYFSLHSSFKVSRSFSRFGLQLRESKQKKERDLLWLNKIDWQLGDGLYSSQGPSYFLFNNVYH